MVEQGALLLLLLLLLACLLGVRIEWLEGHNVDLAKKVSCITRPMPRDLYDMTQYPGYFR